MAQTKEGALKLAARKAGITLDEYLDLVRAGLKRCTKCKAWVETSEFNKDLSRYDGLVAKCRECCRIIGANQYRKTATTKLRPVLIGRSFVPARDGDARQARRRINYFVEVGLMPAARDLPCSDCGHEASNGGPRHEYDHYLGYAAEHHEHVEVVCSRCHSKREAARKAGQR